MSHTPAAMPTQTPAEVTPDLDRDAIANTRQLRPWKVLVLDCNCHSFRDVEIALCVCVPGMTLDRAKALAVEIDGTGSAVVATVPRELAEHIADGLGRRGLRVRVESDS